MPRAYELNSYKKLKENIKKRNFVEIALIKKWKEIMNLKNYNINDMYVDEIKQLLKCIKTQKKSINDIDQGLKTLKIALAIQKSAKSRKTVNV